MQAKDDAESHLSSIILFSTSTLGFLLLVMALSVTLFHNNQYIITDSITGQSISPTRVRVVASLDSICIINLTEGYNLFSSACVSNATTLSEELAYIYQDYDAIYTYDDSNAKKWDVYVPNLPSWVVQGISSIDDRKGYIVVMRINQTLIIEGERYSPRIVGYPPGFSLIGIPSITENTSSDLFSSLNSSLIRVYSMNNTLIQNDPLLLDYMNYTVLTGTGALQIIIPDMGLWFYANDTGSIDVTW